MLREDEQELVVKTDSFINLLVDLLAGGHVMRGKPAADPFVLQVSVEAVGELLVFGGVADEAGVELDRLVDEGGREGR